jgi:hypothetical protein
MPTRVQIAFAAGGALLAVVAGYSYFPVPLAATGPVLGVLWMAALGGISGLFMKAMFVKS